MAPRPSMGVPGPRNVPPYKYAPGVRNPNPQVVQPIALQQVRTQYQSRHPASVQISDLTVITFSCSFLVQTQPAVHVQGQEPLTPSMLAAAPPQEQKQMLGNDTKIM